MKIFCLAILIINLSAATRVDCGGPGGSDYSGNVWQSDISYTGGATWGANPGPTPPYYYLRYGLFFTYNFPVQPGNYKVTLKFLEPNKTAINQRQFKVLINDVLVIPNLDVFSQVGSLTPYDISISILAGNNIKIQFISLIGNAIISGIQIDPTIQMLTLERCQGSGPGWDCAGLYRIKFLWGGSIFTLIGGLFDASANWIEEK